MSQGLRKKFGIDSDALKGKSFFDKIIQLPFSMPIGLYDIKNYISHLLNQIGMEFQEKELALYVDLVDYSIGFNPRSLKRLFNSLLLLNIVAEKKGILSENKEMAQKYEMQRILFATICLQTGYEKVYKYLLDHSEKISQELLQNLADESSYDEVEDLKQFIGDTIGNDSKKKMKLASFMSALYDAIQLEQDDDQASLSDEEIEALKKVLSFSSITSTESSDAKSEMDWDQRYANRDFIKKMNEELYKKFRVDLKTINAKLALYQPRQSSDVWSYLTLKKQLGFSAFDINFYYGEQECESSPCYSIYVKTNKRAVPQAKEWLETVLPGLFDTDNHITDWAAYFYHREEQLPRELSEQERKNFFKLTVTEFLAEVLPKIAEYIQKKS